jgi:hypothetical protein
VSNKYPAATPETDINRGFILSIKIMTAGIQVQLLSVKQQKSVNCPSYFINAFQVQCEKAKYLSLFIICNCYSIPGGRGNKGNHRFGILENCSNNMHIHC